MQYLTASDDEIDNIAVMAGQGYFEISSSEEEEDEEVLAEEDPATEETADEGVGEGEDSDTTMPLSPPLQ